MARHRNPTKMLRTCGIYHVPDGLSGREAVGYTTGCPASKGQQGLSMIDFSNFPTTKILVVFVSYKQKKGMKNHDQTSCYRRGVCCGNFAVYGERAVGTYFVHRIRLENVPGQLWRQIRGQLFEYGMRPMSQRPERAGQFIRGYYNDIVCL